jgi:hypothetical protein
MGRVESSTTAELTSVHGSGAGDIWAVGARGIILHYDGSSWRQVPSGTRRTLHNVFSTDPGDAWAVGEGNTVLRWDGSLWRTMTATAGASNAFYAVWASSPADVWLAGGEGLLHWDGIQWSAPSGIVTGYLFGLAGNGPDDVWAAGDTVMHWNGRTWSAVNAGTTAIGQTRPYAVWTSCEETWIIGEEGTAVRYGP